MASTAGWPLSSCGARTSQPLTPCRQQQLRPAVDVLDLLDWWASALTASAYLDEAFSTWEQRDNEARAPAERDEPAPGVAL